MAKKPDSSATLALKQARKSAKLAAKDAKFQKKLAEKAYKEKIKEMRPYLKKLGKIDLRKDLTAYQKRSVKQAWTDYERLTVRPNKVYRTKDKAKLAVAKRAGQNTGKTKFDVAFIPAADPKARIEIKGDSVLLHSKHVTEKLIRFDMIALATDPRKEIERVLAENPEFKVFVMMADEYIFNGPIPRSLIVDKAFEKMMAYAPGGRVYDDPNHRNSGPNHHYLNWAIGLKAFRSHNQADVNAYTKAYNDNVRDLKDGRKRKRKARKLKYGKNF